MRKSLQHFAHVTARQTCLIDEKLHLGSNRGLDLQAHQLRALSQHLCQSTLPHAHRPQIPEYALEIAVCPTTVVLQPELASLPLLCALNPSPADCVAALLRCWSQGKAHFGIGPDELLSNVRR